ncbi:MAG: hypothetical protein M1405_00085 [Patescibacteria group bacterium]|nr:hypothetical protein [Patescibacteria group bacterium]
MRKAALFKSIIFVLLVFFSLLLIKAPTFAQAPVQPQTQPVNSYTSPNTNPDVPNNLHNWTQNVMIEVMSAMTCQLAGVDPTNPSAKCLGVDQKTGKIGFVENGGGAVGVMGNLITILYTPPIRSRDYINYLSQNFGISKPTYAVSPAPNPCYQDPRGIGFCGLSKLNLIGVWSVFRNIVYLIFILVFVIIGIAIMLRVKIDPRTVMTIQNQIPKIIIGLLMVTFSFAIAGFLIDVMYVAIYLFFNVFSETAKSVPNADLSTLNPVFLQGNTPFAAFDAMAKGGASGGGGFNAIMGVAGPFGDMFRSIIGIGGPLGGVLDNSPVNILIHTISSIAAIMTGIQVAQANPAGFFGNIPGLNTLIGGGAGIISLAGFEVLLREIIPNTIIFLIIFIAVFAALIRLWFTLIIAYVMVLVDVIFAPFWIIAGLMPGGNSQNVGFGAWLRDIVANLSAFPVTIAMFLIGKMLSTAVGATQTGGQFVPPLVGNPGVSGAIGALITVGVILSTPSVVNMTKAAFKAPKIDLAPIGRYLGTGTAVVGAPGSAASAIVKQALVFEAGDYIRRRLPKLPSFTRK